MDGWTDEDDGGLREWAEIGQWEQEETEDEAD